MPAPYPNPRAIYYKEPNLLIPGKKPVRSAKVDWSNSLTRGLISALIFNEGRGHPRDLARPGVIAQRKATAGNTPPVWDTGPFDVSGYNPSIESYWQYTENLVLPNNEVTFLFIGRIDALQGPVNSGFYRTGDPATGGHFFIIRQATQYPWVRVGGVSVLSPGSGTTIPFGINRLGMGFSGASKKGICQVDINGEQSHSSSLGGTLDPTEFISFLGLHFFVVDDARIEGQYSTIYIFDSYLDFDRRQELLNDPYQILLPA